MRVICLLMVLPVLRTRLVRGRHMLLFGVERGEEKGERLCDVLRPPAPSPRPKVAARRRIHHHCGLLL